MICAGPRKEYVAEEITRGNMATLQNVRPDNIKVEYHSEWKEDQCKVSVLIFCMENNINSKVE